MSRDARHGIMETDVPSVVVHSAQTEGTKMYQQFDLMTKLAAAHVDDLSSLRHRGCPVPLDGGASTLRATVGAALIAIGERVRGTPAPRRSDSAVPA